MKKRNVTWLKIEPQDHQYIYEIVSREANNAEGRVERTTFKWRQKYGEHGQLTVGANLGAPLYVLYMSTDLIYHPATGNPVVAKFEDGDYFRGA